MKNKRLIVGIISILLGILCQIIYFVGSKDIFWSSLGGGLIGAGIIHLYMVIKYRKSESYRENIDITEKDERYRYISLKAWAFAGYIFIFLCAAAVIAFKLAGYDFYASFLATALCTLIILYVIMYLVFRKRY